MFTEPSWQANRHRGQLSKRVNIQVYPQRPGYTFALMLLKIGGDLYTPQYLLGHEHTSTVREYVKIAAQDAKEMHRSPLDALG